MFDAFDPYLIWHGRYVVYCTHFLLMARRVTMCHAKCANLDVDEPTRTRSEVCRWFSLEIYRTLACASSKRIHATNLRNHQCELKCGGMWLLLFYLSFLAGACSLSYPAMHFPESKATVLVLATMGSKKVYDLWHYREDVRSLTYVLDAPLSMASRATYQTYIGGDEPAVMHN